MQSFKAGSLLACLGLLLLLSLPNFSAYAQSDLIVVDDTCSLLDAINAANTDAPSGACVAGNGADVIFLTQDVILSETASIFERVGLPLIESQITIRGNGYRIQRDPEAPQFRLFYIDRGAELTLDQVQLIGGADTDNGGAILNFGNLTINRSYIAENQAEVGGAIYTELNSLTSIRNSTFYNNAADSGAAIFNQGSVAVYNSSVVGNRALNDTSTPVGVIANSDSGNFALTNSIVAHNNNLSDCTSALASALIGGSNIDSSDTCPDAALPNGIPTEPNFEAGLTPAIIPSEGSNAIDSADEENCSREHQLGRQRLDLCDIGAVEVSSIEPTTSAELVVAELGASPEPEEEGDEEGDEDDEEAASRPDRPGEVLSLSGVYIWLADGRQFEMILHIDSLDAETLSGRIVWPSFETVTQIEGTITFDRGSEGRIRWAFVEALGADDEGLWLRFTETAFEDGSRVQLGTNFYAQIKSDGGIIGVQFLDDAAVSPLGEFNLVLE